MRALRSVKLGPPLDEARELVGDHAEVMERAGFSVEAAHAPRRPGRRGRSDR